MTPQLPSGPDHGTSEPTQLPTCIWNGFNLLLADGLPYTTLTMISVVYDPYAMGPKTVGGGLTTIPLDGIWVVSVEVNVDNSTGVGDTYFTCNVGDFLTGGGVPSTSFSSQFRRIRAGEIYQGLVMHTVQSWDEGQHVRIFLLNNPGTGSGLALGSSVVNFQWQSYNT